MERSRLARARLQQAARHRAAGTTTWCTRDGRRCAASATTMRTPSTAPSSAPPTRPRSSKWAASASSTVRPPHSGAYPAPLRVGPEPAGRGRHHCSRPDAHRAPWPTCAGHGGPAAAAYVQENLFKNLLQHEAFETNTRKALGARRPPAPAAAPLPAARRLSPSSACGLLSHACLTQHSIHHQHCTHTRTNIRCPYQRTLTWRLTRTT
jgi:hypothetical protein